MDAVPMPFGDSVTKDEPPFTIEAYIPLVKKIAHNLLVKLPPTIGLDDLVQAGMIGLLEASRNFDATKGASFTTFASIRVRGSMIDELRKGEWAPRSVHKNSRRVLRATQAVEHRLQRDAKGAEVAQELGISLAEYHQILLETAGRRLCGFEEAGLYDTILTEGLFGRTLSPLEYWQEEGFKEFLINEIARLPSREGKVLALYYDEDLNLRQVGEALGVSESRASQIHSQAVFRLKAKMATWGE